MGAEVSSCCGGNDARDTTQLDTTLVGAPTSAKMAAFKRRIEEGIEVYLRQQDRTKLPCSVQYLRATQSLMLSCDRGGERKVRCIPLSEIRALLHTREQLRRVEKAAGITSWETCAAIHLAATENCVPIFFQTTEDKEYFVLVVEEALRTGESSQQQPPPHGSTTLTSLGGGLGGDSL